MEIKIKKMKGLKLPKKGSDQAAGLDVVATTEPQIKGESWMGFNDRYKSIDYIEYGTNLFVKPEEKNIFLSLRPRSSISRYNLVLANSPATIDADYRGQIFVRFKYIMQVEDILFFDKCMRINFDKIYKVGDKICQLLPEVFYPDIQFKLVDELNETERGEGGFGSTGE